MLHINMHAWQCIKKERLQNVFLLLCCVGCMFVLMWHSPQAAHAQFGGASQFLNVDAAAQSLPDPDLQKEPRYPEPDAEVEVSLPSTVRNVSGGIEWFVDGIEHVEYANNRSITLTTKDIGEPTTVEARILEDGFANAVLSTTIVPTQIDIIIEGETFVPYFYKGRALPSRASSVLITAIPHTGDNLSYREYTYKWTVGSEVLQGGNIRGKYQTRIEAPIARPAIVTLNVTNAAGNLVSSKTFSVPTFDPLVHFYEANPLRGIHQVVLEDSVSVSRPEITIRAEPYYFDPAVLEGEHQVGWNINSRMTDNPSSDPQEITLRNPEQGNNTAHVEFSLHSLTQLAQFVGGDMRLSFENENE